MDAMGYEVNMWILGHTFGWLIRITRKTTWPNNQAIFRPRQALQALETANVKEQEEKQAVHDNWYSLGLPPTQ